MKWFWAMALAVLGWWGWQQLHGPVAPRPRRNMPQ